MPDKSRGDYIYENEVPEFFPIKVGTIKAARSAEPPEIECYRFSRGEVYYKREDLEAWIEGRRQNKESKPCHDTDNPENTEDSSNSADSGLNVPPIVPPTTDIGMTDELKKSAANHLKQRISKKPK